jgi:hypothetical protein
MWQSTPEVQLFQSDILFFLPFDILPYQLLVPANCGYEVAASPEVLSHEVPSLFSVDPSQVDRALSLDEPDHLRHRIFRWDRDQHVDVIHKKVPLFDPALLLLGQLAKHLPQVLRDARF